VVKKGSGKGLGDLNKATPVMKGRQLLYIKYKKNKGQQQSTF
jgi:hypothetical protein